jgi:hypothetical protein
MDNMWKSSILVNFPVLIELCGPSICSSSIHVNLELLLVLFPVLFICFQMSLHVHPLYCLYIYFFHYLFTGSGLSWFLIKRYGGYLFARTIISELLGCLFARTFIFTLGSNSNPK